MTKDDIIRMAREAGFRIDPEGEVLEGDGWHIQTDIVERFAALAYEAGQESMKWDGIHSCHPDCQRPACVHTRKAVEAEREACAKVCADLWCKEPEPGDARDCHDAIRARRE